MNNKGLMSYSVEIMIDNFVLHVSKHAILEMGFHDWAIKRTLLIGYGIELPSASVALRNKKTYALPLGFIE